MKLKGNLRNYFGDKATGDNEEFCYGIFDNLEWVSLVVFAK